MSIKENVYLLKSFGVDATGGNPAGVVLRQGKKSLTDAQMSFISQQVNYSETAFVEDSTEADFNLRFFTPTDEVGLCGHATIAAHWLLFHLGLSAPGKYTQKLKAGLLGIEIEPDGLVIMEQNLPQFLEHVDEKDIKKIFGDVMGIEGLRAQITSTGLADVMLPVASRQQLFALKPDFKNMAEFNKRTNSIGFHAFTLDTIDPHAIAHSRNFCPLYGIDEESATGSSTGALACFLYKYGKLHQQNLSKMKFEQGYSMHLPSEISASLQVDGQEITKVSIGGKAILFGEREVEAE